MDVSNEQRRQIAEIAEKHRLQIVLLFGSAIGGKSHAGSDLDIAVQFAGQPPDFGRRAELLHDLQMVFSGCEVDLSLINHADPLFLKKITENCLVLFGQPRKIQELKIYAFKRYQDHRRYLDMERAYLERFLRERASRHY